MRTTVLVLEDAPLLRSFRRVLARRSFHVLCAETEANAIELVRGVAVDVAIVDAAPAEIRTAFPDLVRELEAQDTPPAIISSGDGDAIALLR